METVPANNTGTPSSHPAAANAPPPDERSGTAPPPSYFDVIGNEEQYKPKDSAVSNQGEIQWVYFRKLNDHLDQLTFNPHRCSLPTYIFYTNIS
jgi:hypothetical protein